MSKHELEELLLHTAAIEKDLQVWKPVPGPQTQAYHSTADVLFYGGSAGGGKTELLLGLAHTAHRRSIIFRREYPQLKGIEDRSYEIFRQLGDYNRSDKIWRFHDGRIIEFGAVNDEKDKEKYQGRAHDLKGFDEITHFLYSQFTFLIGWTRSTYPGQRTRIICTGNPPTSSEGDWVINYWGPWLDDRHPNPASPGELRWFTNIDGKDIEVENGEPFMHGGELVTPMSRTFIPASVDDNPYLRDSGYKRALQALPEPLRSKMLKGLFNVGREDDPWQVIPSEWVEAAQARWLQRAKPQMRLSAIGADVARGGPDKTVLTLRYGTWFAPQLSYPGTTTPDGPAVASLIMAQLEEGTSVNVDIIGVGTSVYDVLKTFKVKVFAMNGAEGTDEKDRTDNLCFYNQRAEWWWGLREALDPESGDELALPPGRELLVDLTSPRWELTSRGIKIEDKKEIKKRIGRSPDLGDSLVYALAIKTNTFAFGAI